MKVKVCGMWLKLIRNARTTSFCADHQLNSASYELSVIPGGHNIPRYLSLTLVSLATSHRMSVTFPQLCHARRIKTETTLHSC